MPAARRGSGPISGREFTGLIPEDERGDLIAAYNRRLFSGDLAVETRHARAWAAWENALASIDSDGRAGDAPADYARAFARLENHYFLNAGFLDERRPYPRPDWTGWQASPGSSCRAATT